MEDKLGKVGVIGRFRPLHNGAATLLESICEKADDVIIGIGSSNKYNVRNPFTAEETEEMISVFLSGRFNNYRIIKVPDFAHIKGCENGQKWREFVKNGFGKLNFFISGNDFVVSLLKDDYQIIHPAKIVPSKKHVLLKATRVRYEMATYREWKKLVPEKIAGYLETRGLVDRFRKEFGLQAIAYALESDYNQDESGMQEMMHAKEVSK